jgi:hypothetical protein
MLTILALTFKPHSTARIEEVVGALVAIGGAAFFVGAMAPMGRRVGQILGGLALVAAGVLFVLAVRYGVHP